MSQISQILQQLAIIQEWINAVNADKKPIRDLINERFVIDPSDFILLSSGVFDYKTRISTLTEYINTKRDLTENIYPDIASMLADQVNQTPGRVQYVIDGTGDITVIPTGSSVYYEKLETNDSVLEDYRKLSILEIENLALTSDFSTFKIDDMSLTPVVSTPSGSINIQYEIIENKITAIVFDNVYSSYLSIFASTFSGLDFHLKLYDKTNKKAILTKITGLEYTDAAATHYRVLLDSTMLFTSVNVGDIVQIEISVSESSSASKVLVFGNPFSLVKNPTNVDPLKTKIIENNDIITDGWFDSTTFWPAAICINESDINNAASWNQINPIEEIPLI